MVILFLAVAATALPQIAVDTNGEVGSRACAACHAEIYRTYMETGMANSSGRVGTGVPRERFEHSVFSQAALGADFRLSKSPQGYLMEFSLPAAGVQGRRVLEWYVGSGSVGRSYLFSREGYLFQAPVSYYSSTAKWGLSPGYRTLDLTRGVETACLKCHASRLQHVAGTENHFEPTPFLEGGIGCERCHGPGKRHVAGEEGTIVNPANLDPPRRDGVCALCHLTGAARIARRGKELGGYQAGEMLSDYVAVFVWAEKGAAELTATSHYEKLHQSACKKAAGDRMWCGSCHDPHEQPGGASRVAYYRERCLACHEQMPCKEAAAMRRENGDNCTACHMPKNQAQTMEHIAFTEHAIPRRPTLTEGFGSRSELVPFLREEADDRDLALAYASAAVKQPSLRGRSLALLERAATGAPDDLPVLTQLAQFHDRMGNEKRAMALSERIVALDPTSIAAAVNLGVYRIKQGRAEEAIRLWRAALIRNAGLTNVRMNLAVAQFRVGDTAAAQASLLKALEFDPTSEAARKLLVEVRAASGQ